jgi:signal peptidase I
MDINLIKMNKKIVLSVFAIIIALLIVFIRFMPASKMPAVLKNSETVGKILCLYPVQVAGSSMEPVLKEGSRINFNKCFDQNALAVNDIIMFQDRDLKRMAVIREIESGQNGTTYKASQEARRGEIMEIRPEQVIAVYKIQL